MSRTSILRRLFLIAASPLMVGGLRAQSNVGEVAAILRPASSLVDVTYRLDGVATTVNLGVGVLPGGSFAGVGSGSLVAGGAFGPGVSPGAGKVVTWDSGSALLDPAQRLRTRLTVSAQTAGMPSASLVAVSSAGDGVWGDSFTAGSLSSEWALPWHALLKPAGASLSVASGRLTYTSEAGPVIRDRVLAHERRLPLNRAWSAIAKIGVPSPSSLEGFLADGKRRKVGMVLGVVNPKDVTESLDIGLQVRAIPATGSATTEAFATADKGNSRRTNERAPYGSSGVDVELRFDPETLTLTASHLGIGGMDPLLTVNVLGEWGLGTDDTLALGFRGFSSKQQVDPGEVWADDLRVVEWSGPSFAQQPADVVAQEGTDVVLSIGAVAPGETVQWFVGGAQVVGATSGELRIQTADTSKSGYYHAVKRGAAGVAASRLARVSVIGRPEVTASPRSGLRRVAEAWLARLDVLGAQFATYLWSKDRTPVAGATGAQLSLSSVSLADQGVYKATARGGVNASVDGAPAFLEVATAQDTVFQNGFNSSAWVEPLSSLLKPAGTRFVRTADGLEFEATAPTGPVDRLLLSEGQDLPLDKAWSVTVRVTLKNDHPWNGPGRVAKRRKAGFSLGVGNPLDPRQNFDVGFRFIGGPTATFVQSEREVFSDKDSASGRTSSILKTALDRESAEVRLQYDPGSGRLLSSVLESDGFVVLAEMYPSTEWGVSSSGRLRFGLRGFSSRVDVGSGALSASDLVCVVRQDASSGALALPSQVRGISASELLPAGLRLSWQPSAGATSYDLIRVVVDGGTAGYTEQLNTLPIVGTSFSDTTALSGRKYRYFVRARSAVGESLLGEGLVASPRRPKILAAGDGSFVIDFAGRCFGFGRNAFGELGDATSVQRSVPVHILPGREISVVASGGFHTLFLDSEGIAWGAGRNDFGQLGFSGPAVQTSPAALMPDVVALAAGDYHSIFVRSDGSAWTVGENTYGELGDGSTTRRFTPVRVLEDVLAVAAGGRHSLFLTKDGTLLACGLNTSGQLGVGFTNASRPTVVAYNVTQVVAGANHTLFITSSGDLYGCGDASSGQLGDGSTVMRRTPILIRSGVTACAAGAGHSLFVTSDGKAWATGRGTEGQLGNGFYSYSLTPVLVRSSVESVSAGDFHSLFLRSDGAVLGCGSGSWGQLAFLPGSNQLVPVVIGLSTSSAPTFSRNLQSTLPLASGQGWRLEVAASAAPKAWYQWQRNGVDLPGETSPALTSRIATAADSGARYRCIVTNSLGSITSVECVLTVHSEPALTLRSQPVSRWVVAGGSTQFTVGATSIEPIQYQWLRNGVPIDGATGSELMLVSIQADQAGNYSCLVSDTDEVLLTNAATLGLGTPPVIWQQPSNLSIQLGDTGGLSISAGGDPAPTYLWRRNGVPIPGATGSSFLFQAFSADRGSYDCIVSNALGNVTSTSVQVTVLMPADYTAWTKRTGLAARGTPYFEEDPDGDGMTNGEEYAFASDPLVYGKVPAYYLFFNVPGRPELILTAPTRVQVPFGGTPGVQSGRVGGIAYAVTASTDLVDWTQTVTELGINTVHASGLPPLPEGWCYRSFLVQRTAGQVFLRISATAR